LLLEIEKEGFSSDAGLRRLSNWLEANADSELPAVSFLREVVNDILSCGNINIENAAKMQNAIVRVLPRSIQIAEINSEDFSEKLPARKSALKRIRELGGEPPPGITRIEAYDLEAKLKTHATKKQVEYIRALGRNPTTDMSRWDAADLIENLLNSARPTEKQRQFIRELGGDSTADISRAAATTLINTLLAERREKQARQNLPTPRQTMVIRFWNRMDLVGSSQWEVERWLTEFYKEDPRRKNAWEAFKLEVGDDGSQHDPSSMPIGAGERYLHKPQ
jgi:hypothetical protein